MQSNDSDFTSPQKIKKREVEIKWAGGEISSDSGGMLLTAADKHLKLTDRVSKVLPDPRSPSHIDHNAGDMLRQRIYGIALGHEDLNDHDELRNDPAFQTFVGTDKALASSPTLCRFEAWSNDQNGRKLTWDIHSIMMETFLNSFDQKPDELILDIDATDDLVYGNQEGKFFNAHYDGYCFLPLYIFCGKHLLVSYLRHAMKSAALHASAVLKLVVIEIQKRWPDVRIIVRGDGGFCLPSIMNYFEKHGIFYTFGMPKNSRLLWYLEDQMKRAEKQFSSTKEDQKIFTSFNYAPASWKKSRKIIGKASHNENGDNPRFVVTNLPYGPRKVYEKVYCGRCEMENRIKEQKLHLFSDRTSCKLWWANQFRLLLSSLAYILLDSIRRIGLKDTKFEKSYVGTIRLKLLKIGAVIIRNSRKVKFLMTSHYPYKEIFLGVCKAFEFA